MSTFQHTWETLPNPFRINDANSTIIGHVSGRSTDIKNIITGNQSAIILTGAPLIGKTTFIRYLKEPHQATTWPWRKEEKLATLHNLVPLDQVYFVQIDLAPQAQISQLSDLYQSFINECIHALWQIHQPGQRSSFSGLKGLRELLRDMEKKYPEARYFVMLDTIERLLQTGLQVPNLVSSVAQTPQERAISLLNHSDIIHTLVDMIDEFNNFGVILSIESLPQPRMLDQFVHVSVDLARFTTTILQCFTWNDTAAFLAQQPEDFGEDWAQLFKKLGGNASTWRWMGTELRYILSNEGLIRYDLLQPVYHPGAILRNYLLQQLQQIQQENKIGPTIARNYWFTISIPGQPSERLMLSELEYHLLKVLLQQHPTRCSEEALMKGAWGNIIEKATFTQRMHHLKKKLRKHSQDHDMITNHYGGQYSLNHAEWLHLE